LDLTNTIFGKEKKAQHLFINHPSAFPNSTTPPSIQPDIRTAATIAPLFGQLPAAFTIQTGWMETLLYTI